MVTTVLFDMGGTLEELYRDAAVEEKCFTTMYRFLTENGFDPQTDMDDFKYRLITAWKDYGDEHAADMRCLKPVDLWCDYILADFDFDRQKLELIAEKLSHQWELISYRRTLRPNTLEMLEGLKSLGIKMGIISDTPSLYQVFETLEFYGIRDYFQDVTLSTFVGYRKPHEEMFQLPLRQMRSKPEECIYVGDTVRRDVIGCKQAGFFKAIQIPSILTHYDREIETVLEADYQIDDIYEVYEIVKQLVDEENIEIQETARS